MLGYLLVDHVSFECSFVDAPGVRLAKAVLGSLVEHQNENEKLFD